MKITIDASIFRDYDIRGIYPKQINENVYKVLGQAVATYLKVPEIAVGYDTRLSSPSLFKAFAGGITSQGVNVVNLGLISTEIHYFASGFYKYPANCIISASHNPPQYNGLKIVIKGVVPLNGGFGLPEIKQLSLDQNFSQNRSPGKVADKILLKEWITHCLNFINKDKLKSLKVAVDTGNGMGGISWRQLQNKLPVEIIPLYFELDGHFPNHLPDPLNAENLKAVQKKIISRNADLGFATDGDADRLFVLDEKGQVLSGTITTAILCAHLLQKKGPAAVLYNVVCGKIVPETIKKFGGDPIRVRVGHSFIKQYMKKYNALFAGEHSGHFYFRDNYYADSSLIAGLLILEYISLQNKPLSQIAKEFQKYQSSGEINFKIDNPRDKIKLIDQKIKDAKSKDYIDGLSVWYKNWWFNLRSSNTEPLLRLNAEADDSDILTKNLVKIKNMLISIGGVETNG